MTRSESARRGPSRPRIRPALRPAAAEAAAPYRRGLRSLGVAVVSLFGVLALSGAARAQHVRWDAPATLGAGQRDSLDLVFDGTEPAGRVALPAVAGLTVLGPPSHQSTVSIINGARTGTDTLSFPVRAEREGQITIPAFTVATAAGTESVAPLTIEVGAATVPSSGGHAAVKASDAVEARLVPSNMTPYAGEVFDVDQTVSLNGGRGGQVVGSPSWSPGIAVETWGDGRQVRTRDGSGVRFHTRAAAPQPGRIELAPAEQEVQIAGGRTGANPFAGFEGAFGAMRKFGGTDLLDSFFGQAQTTTVMAKSNAVQLDVQPLPAPAPPGFSGAVGQFEIESRIAPAELKTGEPITWTMTLKGTGNWPALELPARAVPNDFRTLQPKQQKQFAAGELFSGAVSEDLVLIPNQPGDYRLDPVRFTFFDPTTAQYRTIEAQPPMLHITGAPVAAQPQPAAVPAAAPAPAPGAGAAAVAPPVADAGRLPHEPLQGTASTPAPLSAHALAMLAATPLLLLFIYWVAVAVQRARLADPRRPQRLAFAQLRPAVARVGAASSAAERIAALLDWQRTAALALGVELAAPTARHLPERWAEVWRDSERGIYGPAHELPAGWCEQAVALCTPARRRWLAPLHALSWRAMLPKAATALLLLALAAIPARAAEPLDAYGKGDFAAARTELAARAAAAPSDWIARYNLGLAEAQLGDAPRALGETLAAFVATPANDDVRWNAAVFAARVPGLDRAAATLIAAPGLAGTLSPSAWQLVLIAAAVTLSIGAAGALRSRYASAGPRRGVAGAAVAIVGLAGMLTALAALHRYGPLADPRAAVVAGAPSLRSVPTDAEQPQQQRSIAAGTLVVVERDFLGWVKVGLGGGETGWLRSADLVPLYAAPAA